MDAEAATRAVAWDGPAVGLLDLDAFFASVEQLDHPEWRGKPVIVGGDPERRGVVSTASYEARRYGVHSAMPSAQARRLCPDAIWTRGDYARYREVSGRVMAILGAETPYVEQVSIDEAFFDVTPGRYSNEDPVTIVRRVSDSVRALGVTCSIGLSVNKTTSKIASERNKPRGITVVYPGTQRAFLAPLSVRSMSGVGARAEQALRELGITTLGDLAAADPEALERRLGVLGPRLVLRARGEERSPVVEQAAEEDVKSVSNERTFAEDLTSGEDVRPAVGYLSSLVARRLRRRGIAGRTVTLKIAFSYGDTHTVRTTLPVPTDDEHEIAAAARGLLPSLWHEGDHVRLMGVGVSGFSDGSPTEQLSLFQDVERDDERRAKNKRLAQASDALRSRFGDAALMYGSELRFRERTSHTAPQHKPDV
ncbi:DNA polymerase IV [bacterium]|nr:DNA polymerase IV [bacterium]